jgi:hypothetical protein
MTFTLPFTVERRLRAYIAKLERRDDLSLGA